VVNFESTLIGLVNHYTSVATKNDSLMIS